MTTQPITEEKKQQILEAALRQFAEHGYEKASTNTIIQEAGVSKGLLFHYFGSKKSLYLHTVDMCLNLYLARFDEKTKNLSDDLSQRLIEISLIKLKIAAEEPLMHRLIASAFIDSPHELKDELQSRYQELYLKYLPLITEKIDPLYFIEGIDPKKAVDLVMIVINTLSERIIKVYRETKDKSQIDFTAYVADVNEYLLMLKDGIHK